MEHVNMSVQKLTIAEISERLNNYSKIFSAIFTKANGEKRKMVARCGVKKGIKGTGMSYDPASKGLKPVFDMVKGDYRMLNLNTLESITMESQRFEITKV
jgi:hypothetical protein